MAAALAACANPRPGVSNGSVSVCYRAIPTAEAAIHDRGATLIGVHRITADAVRDRLPASARAQLEAENDTVVCALSFKGRFSPGQVQLAPPSEHGTYAIVLISSRHLHLVASAVLNQLPRSLAQRSI
jgi:hypothetical protein